MVDEVKFQADVIAGIEARGILVRDGLSGPLCPTGEPYIELLINATSVEDLTTAMIGAIMAFNPGTPDSRCYWRIRPEADQLPADERIRGYVRFRITDKPVLEPVAMV